MTQAAPTPTGPPTAPRIHGLLLAAGAGRRMGTPKALVDDWLERATRTLRDGGCAEVGVVLGAAADTASELLRRSPSWQPANDSIVVARRWEEGMGESLRAGLAALPPSADGVVVHLVDLPDVGASVVRRVLAAWNGPQTLVRAAYGPRSAPRLGHPVLFGRDHLEGVAHSAVGDAGARNYLRDREVVALWCGDLADGYDIDAR